MTENKVNDAVTQCLVCPDCLSGLENHGSGLSCTTCRAHYRIASVNGKAVPVMISKKSRIGFSEDFGEYALPQNNSFLSRMAKIFWPPELMRYYGDMQSGSGIKNYHKALHRFIEEVSKTRNGLILDLGGGRRRLCAGVINSDLFLSSEVDVVSDANFLPFKSGYFDGVVIQSVLEHIETYEKVLKESERLIKPGGRLYCEVPFFYPVHGEKDYTRFTREMLLSVLERAGFEIVECRPSAGPFSALALSTVNILSAAFSCGYKKIYAAWYIIFGWLMFWIKYLDILCPSNAVLWNIVPVFYVIAKKK